MPPPPLLRPLAEIRDEDHPQRTRHLQPHVTNDMSMRQRVPSLIEADSEEWEVRLRFRDALRSDPALRQIYQQLKRRLLREHAFDLPA